MADQAGNIPVSSDSGSDVPPDSTDENKLTHTVLIVEDTVELAEIIQVTLENLNLRVYHATHGNRALDLFHEVHPDLVLLDIALPDMTGWKVLETMREEQRGGTAPKILVITAYGDPANRLMGKLQGIHGYLIKPLIREEIEKAVRSALGSLEP